MARYVGRVISPSTATRITVIGPTWRAERYLLIAVDDREGNTIRLLGWVESVEAVNPYFATPDRIDFVDEKDDAQTRHAKYVYTVSLVGRLVGGSLDETGLLPPPPGAIVQVAEPLDLEALTAVGTADLELGSLTGAAPTAVRVASASIWSNHSCIIGRTGAGKSHLVRWLIKRLQGKGTILLFAPSAEYREVAAALRTPGRYYDADSLAFRLLPAELIVAMNFGSGEAAALRSLGLAGTHGRAQQQLLWRSQSSERRGDRLDTEALAASLDEMPVEGAHSAAYKLRRSGLRLSEQESLVEDSPGLSVVDLSGFDERAAQFVAARVLLRIFQRRRTGRASSPPMLVFVEEAHNFIPSTHGALGKELFARIAREGRKLGINLVVISQRPRLLDPTVTSQARNFFLFQIPHPDDVDHVLSQTALPRGSLAEFVRHLRERECLVSITNGRALPVTVPRWTD
jgi:DNA helicase HerA-like ATPase